MSKQVRTLSKIATAIVSWANVGAAQRATRAALVEQTESLTLVEKQRVDVELVNYFAAKGGAPVGERTKAHGIYGAVVAKWEREGTDVVEHQRAAAKALSDARQVLFAAELAEKKGAKPVVVKAATLPSILAYAEKRAANEEKISGEERRQIKHAILALSKLIG